MSGLEIVGVVASTLQLAEIGMKLSVKLCSFYRQIKSADQAAQHLASDVSLTCSILNQLGKALEQDRQTRLCSHQAFLTAKEVLDECDRIFKQIEEAMERQDPSSGKSKWNRGARRLTIVMLGPDLDLLKTHLDRLKSTMLLMLNVIMYAREINQTSDHSSLKSQRLLIEKLLQEKSEIEAKFNGLLKVASSSSDSKKELQSSTAVVQPDIRSFQQFPTRNEIDKYYNLIKGLLVEIDTSQYTLQQDRHLRIRDGVVNIHMVELALFRESHGEESLRTFENPLFKPSNLYDSLVSKGETPCEEKSRLHKGKPCDNSLRSSSSSPTPETQSHEGEDKAQTKAKKSEWMPNVQHGGGRAHRRANLRSGSGMVQISTSSSMDPYETPRRYIDYDDYYPSDAGYSTHQYQRPRHHSTIDIQPKSRHTYRDTDRHKRRTEYSIQPCRQTVSRSRSNTTSAKDLHDKPQGSAVLSGSQLVPAASADQADNSLPLNSGHVVYSQSRRRRRRRVYKGTEYASDTGRVDPHDSRRRRSSDLHQVQPQSGRRPADGRLKKGDDIEKYESYYYTSPREQFDRDYPVKPRRATRRTLERPLSMNVIDDHPQHLPDKEHKQSHDLMYRESSKIESKRHRRNSPPSSDEPQTRAKFQNDNDTESEMYTTDDDLRKQGNKSYGTPCRRSSSADPKSRNKQSRGQEDPSRHHSSLSQRSQPMLGDTDSIESSHPIESRDGERKRINVDPPALEKPQTAPKGTLKLPRKSFSEGPNPTKENVTSFEDANKKEILPQMRWTNIDRKMVNPEALDAGNERYEERPGYITVLRILSEDEIQMYAVKTQEIRDNRRRSIQHQRRGHRSEESSSEDADDEDNVSPEIEAPPSTAGPEKADKSESQPMGMDTPSSSHKPPGNSEGYKGWDTLEDIVLSWTTLSRDMIQLCINRDGFDRILYPQPVKSSDLSEPAFEENGAWVTIVDPEYEPGSYTNLKGKPRFYKGYMCCHINRLLSLAWAGSMKHMSKMIRRDADGILWYEENI